MSAGEIFLLAAVITVVIVGVYINVITPGGDWFDEDIDDDDD